MATTNEVLVADKIEKFLKNELDTIDAVIFVIKSSYRKNFPSITYVFNAMSRFFGKDIASNLFLLITCCDANKSPVFWCIDSYKLQYKKAFELNNRAFFEGFDDYLAKGQVKQLDINKDCVESLSKKEQLEWIHNDNNHKAPDEIRNCEMTKFFWDMGMDRMAKLFNMLGDKQTRRKSLQLTRQVIDLRNSLQLGIKSLYDDTVQGLNLISNIRSITDTIKRHVTEMKELQLPGNHLKNNVVKINYSTTVDETEMKEKYDESRRNKMNAEKVLASETRKCVQFAEQVVKQIVNFESLIKNLSKIALKMFIIQEYEDYEWLIECEEQAKKVNYKARVEKLKKRQQHANLIDSLQGKKVYYNKFFDSQLILQQLESDAIQVERIDAETSRVARQCINEVVNCIKSIQTAMQLQI